MNTKKVSALLVVKLQRVEIYLYKAIEIQLNNPDYEDIMNSQLSQMINAIICK